MTTFQERTLLDLSKCEISAPHQFECVSIIFVVLRFYNILECIFTAISVLGYLFSILGLSRRHQVYRCHLESLPRRQRSPLYPMSPALPQSSPASAPEYLTFSFVIARPHRSCCHWNPCLHHTARPSRLQTRCRHKTSTPRYPRIPHCCPHRPQVLEHCPKCRPRCYQGLSSCFQTPLRHLPYHALKRALPPAQDPESSLPDLVSNVSGRSNAAIASDVLKDEDSFASNVPNGSDFSRSVSLVLP